MDTLLSTILPPLYELAGVIITGLIAAVCVAARQYLTAKVGATTTAALSDMLHKALETGVQAAYAADPKATPADMVAAAISHAKGSIPGTLAKLAPTPEVLTNIAMAKIGPLLLGRKP